MLLAFALMQGFSARPSKRDHDRVVRQAVDVFLLGAMKKDKEKSDHGQRKRPTR